MSGVVPIDRAMLDGLVAEARDVARRRRNLNFHAANDAPCQRLLNAIEPDSYVCPHRHLDPAKDETFVVLAGRVGVLIFDEAGAVLSTHVLAPGADCCGITIPAGAFHGVVSLASGSVVFEAKAGPWIGPQDIEFARFAPPEGGPGCAEALARWRALFA